MSTKTLEERLTVAEHKVAENARGIGGLREAIVELGNRMDRRFESMELRFDQRLESMEQRSDQRLESMEQRFERRFESMDRRFESMDQNMSRQFRVIVGIQLTTLLAMVGAIATLAAAALDR